MSFCLGIARSLDRIEALGKGCWRVPCVARRRLAELGLLSGTQRWPVFQSQMAASEYEAIRDALSREIQSAER
jgi:hypothetical protein